MHYQGSRLLSFLATCVLLIHCASSKNVVQAAPEAVPADSIPALPVAGPAIQPTAKTDTFLENLLQQYPQYFDQILRHPDSFRVQVLYTQIDRGANNMPTFRNFYYRVDPQQYFYPASTVKMPTALLALQRLNELGIGLNKYTTMITESAYSAQTPVYNDPTTPDGKPNIAQYIRKIFMVSDNDAYNRLYEFLGQQYLNEQLRKMGYTDVEILHHLEVVMTEDENRHTNPVKFLDADGRMLYDQPMQVSTLAPLSRNDRLGIGFERGGRLIHEPFNFSRKNRIGLEDLHGILRSVLFPQSVPAQQRFNIAPDDYRFVWKYMSQYPAESASPSYDSAGYHDAYGKFLYWGNEKGPLPKQLRIFNKIGDAYGFLVDVAYFADLEKNIEFMLAATILCNSDGVFNDSKYDYDKTGFPFMKHLGRVIYEHELKRPREHSPDLSAFKVLYDK